MRERFDMNTVRAGLAAMFLLGSIAAVHSFTFEPMTISFDPSGPGTVRTFRLKNDSKERIAVRVTILSRKNEVDGSEVNAAVPDGAFVVFPSRFVLEPDATRSLKVQWKGGDPGNREAAYRIIAEQVPVEFQARQGSGISILLKYVGALYIRPPRASGSDVKVVSAIGAEKKGKRGISLRLRNNGGIHAVLTDSRCLWL